MLIKGTWYNRYRGFVGAARAAAKLGDQHKASSYYASLVDLAKAADTERSEIGEARAFLKAH
jgi:hypothetical protein